MKTGHERLVFKCLTTIAPLRHPLPVFVEPYADPRSHPSSHTSSLRPSTSIRTDETGVNSLARVPYTPLQTPSLSSISSVRITMALVIVRVASWTLFWSHCQWNFPFRPRYLQMTTKMRSVYSQRHSISVLTAVCYHRTQTHSHLCIPALVRRFLPIRADLKLAPTTAEPLSPAMLGKEPVRTMSTLSRRCSADARISARPFLLDSSLGRRAIPDILVGLSALAVEVRNPRYRRIALLIRTSLVGERSLTSTLVGPY